MEASVSSAKSDSISLTRKVIAEAPVQDMLVGWHQIVVHEALKAQAGGAPHCTAEALLRPLTPSGFPLKLPTLSRQPRCSPYCPATLNARMTTRALEMSARDSFRATKRTSAAAWNALNDGSCRFVPIASCVAALYIRRSTYL